MALFKSQVLTQASGSVGGLTYTRSSQGMVMRARAVPVQPNTGNQLIARSALSTLVTRWTEVLTATQRAAWNLYASNVPVINPLGDSVTNSGQNWYVAANSPRLQIQSKLGATFSGLAFVDNAPTIFDRGTFAATGFTADAVTGISVVFDDSAAWATETDAFLNVYMGRPQNATRNFFKGPYRLLAADPGVGPATSPFAITAATCAAQAYPLIPDQAIWLALQVTRADGRLSTRQVFGPEIVTP